MASTEKVIKELTELTDTLSGKSAAKRKEKAAARLVDLTCDPDIRVTTCRQHSVLETLVSVLKSPGQLMTVKEKVAACIGNLSLDVRLCGILASHDEMIRALVSIYYTDGSSLARENCTRALGNMGNGNDGILSQISTTPGAVQAFVEMAKAGSIGERVQSSALLWDMAQADIVGTQIPGLIQGLVSTMICESDACQENASAALCALCEADGAENANVLENSDLKEAIAQLLRSDNVTVQENVAELVWTVLTNGCVNEIASSEPIVASMVWLLQFVDEEKEAAVESAIASLRTLTATSKEVCATVAEPDTVANLVQQIRVPNAAIREDGVGTLWNVAYHVRLRKNVVLAEGLLDAFANVLADMDVEDPGPLENVAGAMRMLTAGNDESLEHLSKENRTLSVLATVLASGASTPMEDASAAIWNVCNAMPDKMVACQTPGLLQGLIRVGLHGSDGAKQNASGALSSLAVTQETSEVIAVEKNVLTMLVRLLNSESHSHKEHASAAIGNLAMDSESNMVLIAREEGALEGLVNVIKFGNDAAKENAVAALGNLALNADNMALIAKPGAMEALEGLVNGGSDRAKENAALTLGNLVLNSDDNARMLVETNNLLPGLVRLLKEGTPQAQENAALALSHVAAHAEPPTLLLHLEGTLDNLLHLVRNGTEIAQEDATAAIGNLALRDVQNCQMIGAHSGALAALVDLMRSGSREAVENASIGLGNLSLYAHNEKLFMQVPNLSATICDALQRGTDTARDATCKLVANLVATNTQNRTSLVQGTNMVAVMAACLYLPECHVSSTAALLNLIGDDKNLNALKAIPDISNVLGTMSKESGPEGNHAQLILARFAATPPVTPKGPQAPPPNMVSSAGDDIANLSRQRRVSQTFTELGGAEEPAPPPPPSTTKKSSNPGFSASASNPSIAALQLGDAVAPSPRGRNEPLPSPLALNMDKMNEARESDSHKVKSTNSVRESARTERNTARAQRTVNDVAVTSKDLK